MPSPFIVATPIDRGAILMDTNSGECFELNDVGARVWNAIEGGKAPDEIAREIAERYQLAAERARADLDDLLAMLLRVGAVRPREP